MLGELSGVVTGVASEPGSDLLPGSLVLSPPIGGMSVDSVVSSVLLLSWRGPTWCW